jgi:hypothetical protein
MNGILYIDEASANATTGHMLVTFKSGGDRFRFHLPGNLALRFRQSIIKDAWQVCCQPDAEVVKFKPREKSRKP